MKTVQLPLFELFGIAATRGFLGAGLALLLSDRLNGRQRRILGSVLLTIGIASTAPFAIDVISRQKTELGAEPVRPRRSVDQGTLADLPA